MHEFYFEKLSVWQNARTLVKDIYLCTADFPSQEQFGVASQLRRATTSIAANIAEGMSRAGDKVKVFKSSLFLRHRSNKLSDSVARFRLSKRRKLYKTKKPDRIHYKSTASTQ